MSNELLQVIATLTEDLANFSLQACPKSVEHFSSMMTRYFYLNCCIVYRAFSLYHLPYAVFQAVHSPLPEYLWQFTYCTFSGSRHLRKVRMRCPGQPIDRKAQILSTKYRAESSRWSAGLSTQAPLLGSKEIT